jgi:uncharacterized protein (DUF486 family)
MSTVLLLIASNCFMTFAWYWHLRWGKADSSWGSLILLSWLIALPEYALAVPANRLGHASLGGPFSAPQLKLIQEAIALGIFVIFSAAVLREMPTWRFFVAAGLIVAGLAVALGGRPSVAA